MLKALTPFPIDPIGDPESNAKVPEKASQPPLLASEENDRENEEGTEPAKTPEPGSKSEKVEGQCESIRCCSQLAMHCIVAS